MGVLEKPTRRFGTSFLLALTGEKERKDTKTKETFGRPKLPKIKGAKGYERISSAFADELQRILG